MTPVLEATPIANMLTTIFNGQYTLAGVSFPVEQSKDPKDVIPKAFETIGTLTNTVLATLAKAHNLPVEPFDKRKLQFVLKAIFQAEWFDSLGGGVPDTVAARMQTAINNYMTEIDLLAKSGADDFLSKPTKTRAENPAAPKLLYVIDPVKYESVWKDWRGQKALTVQSMLTLEAMGTTGFTIKQIFENCKETRETKAPTKNAMGLIVNALRQAGIVTLLNPQDERERKPRVKKDNVAAPVAAKATPAVQPKKKK